MTTVDIARRLSFGASKLGFPMDKYLNSIEEWDLFETNFNFLKNTNGLDTNIVQDIAHLKVGIILY